jgi:hypothetical protein
LREHSVVGPDFGHRRGELADVSIGIDVARALKRSRSFVTEAAGS